MTLTELSNKNFWQEFAKDFHIEDQAFQNSIARLSIESSELEKAEKKLFKEGYLHFENKDILSGFAPCSDLVLKFVDQGILPIFALIFDEFWLIQKRIEKVFSTYLDDSYKLLPAIWVWCIDNQNDHAGWAPHRDRDRFSVDENNKPKVLTLWVPLTEAKPTNGCIYLVPAHLDRNYGTENENNLGGFDLASIRALPAKPGDFLIWNHSILHWGAKAAEDSREPRISIGFEFQCGELEPMKEKIYDPLKMPSFEERLDIIASQIIQYVHMYDVPQSMIDFAKSRLRSC